MNAKISSFMTAMQDIVTVTVITHDPWVMGHRRFVVINLANTFFWSTEKQATALWHLITDTMTSISWGRIFIAYSTL
jgi:hypothetical protein